MKVTNLIKPLAVFLLVMTMECVADETKNLLEIKDAEPIDTSSGTYKMINDSIPGLCSSILEMLNRRKSDEKGVADRLLDTLDPLAEIQGVEFIDWKPVKEDDYKHIIFDSSAYVDKDSTAGDHKKTYMKSKESGENKIFYLAHVNVNNSGNFKYILLVESRSTGFGNGHSSPSFYILDDENTLSKDTHIRNDGRVFFYKGKNYIDNTVGGYKSIAIKSFYEHRTGFLFPSSCVIEMK